MRRALGLFGLAAATACGSTLEPHATTVSGTRGDVQAPASAGPDVPGATAAGGVPVPGGPTGGAPGAGGPTQPPDDTTGSGTTGLTARDGSALPPIKIGYAIYDQTGSDAITGASFGGGSADGNIAADKREMEALVKYANATGGIGGRKLGAPVGIKISLSDALDPSTMQSYCTQAAEDNHDQVFIDKAFFNSNTYAGCFASHKVTLVTDSVSSSEAFLNGAAPYIAGTQASVDRAAASMISGLPKTDYLKGATLGLVLDDSADVHHAYDTIIKPGLTALGAKGWQVQFVSSSDPSAQSGQASSAVVTFRSKGVNHVFWFAGFLAQLAFTRNADSQGYRPRYLWGDYAQAMGSALVTAYVPKSQSANSLAISSLDSTINPDPNHPPTTKRSTMSPGYQRCYDVLGKYTGVDYYADHGGVNPGSTETQDYCDHFFLWLDAARKVGSTVTPQSWGQGLRALGSSFDAVWTHSNDFAHRMDGASSFIVGLMVNTTTPNTIGYKAITTWSPF